MKSKHKYFYMGNACITTRYYGPDCFVKLPDGVRRISGREYAALLKIIKEKNNETIRPD